MPESPNSIPGAFAGFGLGVIVTIPLALVAIVQAGAGHGSYVLAGLAFPFAILLHPIVGLVQLPAYGAAIGLLWNRPRALRDLCAALTCAHLLAILLCLAMK